MADQNAGSILLVEEYFAAGDDRFVAALRQCKQAKRLAAFAERWKRDHRPWARQQILDYLQQPLNVPGHQPVVKRLFKHAFASDDAELVAAFAWAFDRLIRRERVTKGRWDWRQRTVVSEEKLVAVPNIAMRGPVEYVKGYNPQTARFERFPSQRKPADSDRLYTTVTRQFLQRMAWRYFRYMAHREPARYPQAVAGMLAHHRDEDLAAGENILDSWSLVHACFYQSDAITFAPRQARLKAGRRLSELSPAPYEPQLWAQEQSLSPLLELLAKARSRLVRVWAISLLEADHAEALKTLPIDRLMPLLSHSDGDLAAFAAKWFGQLQGLEKLTVAQWLALMDGANPAVLPQLCDAIAEHVRPDRLELAQCVALAVAPQTPVARLGLTFLKQRKIEGWDRDSLVQLAEAKCTTAGAEIAAFALGVLGRRQAYDVDAVMRFFDSVNTGVRQGSWDWLTDETPAWNDATVWSRLTESPYDDVKLRLIETLTKRSQLPGGSEDDLTQLWTAVLLNVHRGNRQKRAALRQVSQRIAESPEKAESLLPVLAVALRSVRPAERRAGLVAVVSAVEAEPSLADAVARALPEIDLTPQAAGGAAGGGDGS